MRPRLTRAERQDRLRRNLSAMADGKTRHVAACLRESVSNRNFATRVARHLELQGKTQEDRHGAENFHLLTEIFASTAYTEAMLLKSLVKRRESYRTRDFELALANPPEPGASFPLSTLPGELRERILRFALDAENADLMGPHMRPANLGIVLIEDKTTE